MSTIKQKLIAVPLVDAPRIGLTEEAQINVRRMSWKDTRDFLKAVATHLGSIGVKKENVVDNLFGLITSAEDLSSFLITGCTGMDQEKVDLLDPADAVELIRAGLALHLGEELKKSFAGITGLLTGILPASLDKALKTMSNGGSPTPSSSTTATAPTTSTAAPSLTST
ncbi:hypothetical protein OpiT1DRAFT_03960 [Opitutaceae bacterium TAV1]|nr:hypothetical protein OpiT1DRAFT_03960 [Opitutaceae bacterium TAV1]